jgi:hypothetical protein
MRCSGGVFHLPSPRIWCRWGRWRCPSCAGGPAARQQRAAGAAGLGLGRGGGRTESSSISPSYHSPLPKANAGMRYGDSSNGEQLSEIVPLLSARGLRCKQACMQAEAASSSSSSSKQQEQQAAALHAGAASSSTACRSSKQQHCMQEQQAAALHAGAASKQRQRRQASSLSSATHGVAAAAGVDGKRTGSWLQRRIGTPLSRPSVTPRPVGGLLQFVRRSQKSLFKKGAAT